MIIHWQAVCDYPVILNWCVRSSICSAISTSFPIKAVTSSIASTFVRDNPNVVLSAIAVEISSIPLMDWTISSTKFSISSISSLLRFYDEPLF